MKRYTNADAIKDSIAERKAMERMQKINEADSRDQAEDKRNSFYEAMYAKSDAKRDALKAYGAFSESVKRTLLGECIYDVFNTAVLENVKEFNDIDKKIKYGYVNSFIEENGVDTLLRRFKSKTQLLSEFAVLVEKYHGIIMEKTNKEDPNTLVIDTEDKNSFFEELRGVNTDDINAEIRSRVADGINKFIEAQKKDKEQTDEIREKIQSKIDSVDSESPDAEEIKESYNKDFRRSIVTMRDKRSKTILEAMVYSLVNGTMEKEELKNEFMVNGKVDMDKIVESAVIMYTFLETIGSTKMIDLNEAYIQKVYNELAQ